jgi:hypothetical protein
VCRGRRSICSGGAGLEQGRRGWSRGLAGGGAGTRFGAPSRGPPGWPTDGPGGCTRMGAAPSLAQRCTHLPQQSRGAAPPSARCHRPQTLCKCGGDSRGPSPRGGCAPRFTTPPPLTRACATATRPGDGAGSGTGPGAGAAFESVLAPRATAAVTGRSQATACQLRTGKCTLGSSSLQIRLDLQDRHWQTAAFANVVMDTTRRSQPHKEWSIYAHFTFLKKILRTYNHLITLLTFLKKEIRAVVS